MSRIAVTSVSLCQLFKATVGIVVLVEDVNDNPPVFAESQYTFSVKELLPVDTSVGRVEATDADNTDSLFYYLEPENEYFKLQAVNNPDIAVKKIIDYDVVKQVVIYIHARDTPDPTLPAGVFPPATATITLNIEDVDNRPPWFQPCREIEVGSAKICLGSGYRGRVNLTEKEEGILPLEPDPLHAIDGDKGRNDQIVYSIFGGNEAGIFSLNEISGNITMVKPADVAGPIVLTVLATQLFNRDQFATSSVTFEVVKKSQNPPRFEKQQYEGYISANSGLDSLVLEDKSFTTPLRVQAKDEDFSSGINPDVRYDVLDSNDFTATAEGFILLKREISSGTVSLQLRAEDISNGESGTAALTVQVLPEGAPGPSGKYHETDMAVLGASLAVTVVLCLVIIGLLVFRIRKGNEDWKKLSEASIFRSTLGSTGPKDGMQYTNDGYQNDGDTNSLGSDLPSKLELTLDVEPVRKASTTALENEAPLVSVAQLSTYDTMSKEGSLAGSDKADSEKEVKPILTKERRNEEGYKSVWFKEDIDPEAKEEVVIIPDNRDQDGDEDEDSMDGEEGDDGSPLHTPRVFFTTQDDVSALQNPDKNGASDSEGEEGNDAEL
ncbi:cadherin-related family member 5-like [Megalops cyprinoides]|uniref:cadherin-related family member 5-like n=1 Tax=Megalops cyprinoides TaxID=118141 RepID=UPI001864495D|nr:cadherin-related family member 5-like [Megalops cyprinoides]